jgi:DNA polymerase-1
MVDFDGVLHAQFHQHRVVTGRLSSSDPNLQNQAKKGGTADQKSMEKFLGEKDEDAINRKVRELIVPRKGNVLVSIDWNQAEYRVAVFYSQDERMIGIWVADPKIDYHNQTQIDTGLERDQCKTLNFGILYGMGAASLALSFTGMGKPTTKTEGQQFLNRLFEARPALKRLIAEISNKALCDGFIQNCLGRICHVPRDRSYVALNYLIQGTVGDLMREFMVRIKRIITEKRWPVNMLLSVHDELVFEMRPEDAEIYPPLIVEEMCKCPFVSVPMLADIEIGENSWADAVPYKEWLAGRSQAS